jgi:hypothetical protein
MVHADESDRAAKVMKLKQQSCVIIMVTMLAAGSAWAQTNPVDSAAQPKRDGSVIVPERLTATDSSVVLGVKERPTRPERPNLPPEVQALIERMKQEARAYLARQQDLKKQLQGATDKERAEIRKQLEGLRSLWVERSKEIRKEYKERQAELAEKLTDYRELLDSVNSTSLQDSGGRPRRGED